MPSLTVSLRINEIGGRGGIRTHGGLPTLDFVHSADVKLEIGHGGLVLQYFAITAGWAGDKELALQQLETGLRAPVASQMFSYGSLKLLPFWDPLRGDPRFEKIVASLAPKL